MEHLVGRDFELAQLREIGVRAQTRGAAVIVVGEPGMGKSALLDTAILDTGAFTTVLRATGAEFEVDVGYAGLHQLLAPQQDAFPHLAERHRDTLQACLGLADGVTTPARTSVAAATLALIDVLARAGNLVLVVVDDLQWVDRASAAVLSTVARHLPKGAAFVGALRPENVSFFDAGTLPRVYLGPLSTQAAEQLLTRRAPRIDPVTKQHLLAQAQGNPLALLELPVAMAAEPATGPATDIPARLQELFAPRLTDLPATTRALLLLAALEPTADIATLLRAGPPGITSRDVVTAAQRGLLRVVEPEGTFRFTHPLIRSTVVSLAATGDLRAAHRALGERGRPQLVARAHHLAEAAFGADETVAAMLEEAAHLRLRRGDATGAVADLLRAADLSVEHAAHARRMASAAYVGADVNGDLDGVATLLARAGSSPALIPPTESLESAVAAAYLLLNGDGDVNTSHRLLVAALEDASTHEVNRDVLVEALFTLLWICFFGGRVDLWEPFTRQLERLGPDTPVTLSLCTRIFGTPTRTGATAHEDLRTAIAGLEHELDPAHVVLIARAAFYVDEIASCRSALWRVVGMGGDRAAALTPKISAWLLLGFQAFLDGQWDDALRYLTNGLDVAEARGYELLACPGRYGLALIAAARGENQLCTDLCDAMLRWAQPRSVHLVIAYAHHVQALQALGRSDYEAAYRHASGVSAPGVIEPYLAHALWLMIDLVDAAVHTGRVTEARAHLEAMRAADVGSLSTRFALILAYAEALVAPDETALDMFVRALDVREADRWTFEFARVQLAYGERLRRARLLTHARAQLVSALEAFDLLRASPWVERARSELRASGTDRLQSSRQHPLTGRELEVARLVAAGLTNPQVAARLGISRRTVAAHLSHIMSKLGIRSRAALYGVMDPADTP